MAKLEQENVMDIVYPVFNSAFDKVDHSLLQYNVE